MMDSCYIPNNPGALHYLGLDFQEPLLGTAPSTPPSHMMVQLNGGNSAQYTEQQHCNGMGAAGMWSFSSDEMMNVETCTPSASPIDFQDTVSAAVHNFFPFSPSSSSNASSSLNCKNDFIGYFLPKCGSLNESNEMKETQVQEIGDVLVSLKHSIIHPGQLSPPSNYNVSSVPQCYHNQQFPPNNNQCLFNPAGSSTSLSCTIYPHQLTPLPIDGDSYDNESQPYVSPYLNAFTDAVVAPTGCANALTWSASHSQPIFHGMSVNVSMNMTMHGCPASGASIHQDNPIQCHSQMQWTSLTPTPSPIYQTQQLLSPVGGNATYSFSTNVKPPSPIEGNYVCNSMPSIVRPYNKQSPYHQLSPNSSCLIKCNKKINYDHECAFGNQYDNILDSECEFGKPNLCRICGKTYARPSTLKTHLRTHSGEKPYRCEGCNKSFSQAANLTAHLRTHSGEKPFHCPICDRRFSQSSSVTTHMRTHSGERPYRCRMCKKAFSDSSTLTKHLRIHSGEKPYQCKLCLLRFSQSGNLNRHMRVHSINGTNMLLS